MKGIYKTVKKEVQASIKRIAEKHGIGPLNVLTTTNGEISSEYMTDMEALAKRMHDDFEISNETTWECIEGFQGEIVEFVCPDYNCTIGDGLTPYLNRRLLEEGYSTIDSDLLDFLYEEISQMKPAEA